MVGEVIKVRRGGKRKAREETDEEEEEEEGEKEKEKEKVWKKQKDGRGGTAGVRVESTGGTCFDPAG